MRAVLATDLEDRARAGEIKIDDRETAEPLFFTLFRSRMIFACLPREASLPSGSEICETLAPAVKIFPAVSARFSSP